MKKIILSALLIIIEAILFVLILFINPPYGWFFCYATVALAFIFVLFFTFQKKEYLIPLALLLTLAADFFLVILARPADRPYGMFFFMLVQFIYGIYLFFNDPLHKKQSIILRIIMNLVLVITGIIVLKKQIDTLSLFSIIYFANIITNIICCLFNFRKFKLLFVALVLFILCDIHTGLVIADGVYLTYKVDGLIYTIVNTPFNFTWFFYIPSQALIALYYSK